MNQEQLELISELAQKAIALYYALRRKMNQEQLKLISELAQKAIALYKLCKFESKAVQPQKADYEANKLAFDKSPQPSSTGPGFFAKKPPVARTTNSAGELLVTEKEANRLWMIATKECGWSADDYTKYLQDAYSVTHGRQLPVKFKGEVEVNIKLGRNVAYSRLKAHEDKQEVESHSGDPSNLNLDADMPF